MDYLLRVLHLVLDFLVQFHCSCRTRGFCVQMVLVCEGHGLGLLVCQLEVVGPDVHIICEF